MNLRLNGNQVTQIAGQQPFSFSSPVETSPFPPSSRYHGLQTLTYVRADGKRIAYLDRRFLPDPSKFEQLYEHHVIDGDRLDNLAHRYLGDPEQYWRIADANAAMFPEDLTASAGSKIRITLPEGIPGAQRA